MPATRPSKQFHPLCYEHHLPMEASEDSVEGSGEDTESRSYACTKPECLVHYDTSRGYFILAHVLLGKEGNSDIVPRVRCRQDGRPMYLAEVKPEKRDFRMWTCPQCGGTRTSDEGLISLGKGGSG